MARTNMTPEHEQLADIACRAVGARLKEFRNEKGLTQTDLSKSFDLTFQQIQKYEKGVNRLSVAYLLIMLDQMGVTPKEFFTGLDWRTDPDAGQDDSQMEMFS